MARAVEDPDLSEQIMTNAAAALKQCILDKLREATADLAEGRIRDFDTDDEFVAHLKALDAEGGSA